MDDAATGDARKRFNFRAQPLYILLDGGDKELWRKFGHVTREELKTQLETALPK